MRAALSAASVWFLLAGSVSMACVVNDGEHGGSPCDSEDDKYSGESEGHPAKSHPEKDDIPQGQTRST